VTSSTTVGVTANGDPHRHTRQPIGASPDPGRGAAPRVGLSSPGGATSPSGATPHDDGNADGSALSRCIDIPAEQFATQHWGHTPRLTRAAHGRDFRDLLDERAVDELVSERGLRTPFLRMAKGGNVLPGQRFTRSGGSGATIADQVADDKVLAQLADGATLVLQALHRTWPPLIRFGSALAAELGHPAQINAYITPPQNQGFAAHYDTHDVFVLQVSGRKRWRIHEPVLVDPLPEQNWEKLRDQVAARAAEEPLIDTVLEPGDALYLPRGYLHSAAALGDLTIHLTIGVHPVTRDSLLRQLVQVAADDANLRASLPMGVDLADPAVLAGHVAATARALAEFAEGLNPAQSDAVAMKIGATLAENTRPEPIGPLAQGAAAATLTGLTPLRVRSGLRYALSTDAEHAVLRVLDKTVTMSATADTALKTVLSGGRFTPHELPALDPDEQLALARQLLREGIVVPAQTPVA
jgi:bifunctional lysine-specific demethylase and histidyl-hydroxylase NO66